MLFNNAVSAGIGLVPIVGDVCIAAFKANSRNAALLEEYLRIRGDEFLKSQSPIDKLPEEDIELGYEQSTVSRVTVPLGRPDVISWLPPRPMPSCNISLIYFVNPRDMYIYCPAILQ